MYYPCSENKDADQLRGYREADLRLCFRPCNLLVFSRTGSIINDLLDVLYDVTQHDTVPRLEFTDGNCKAWTGWTLRQLNEYHDHCRRP